MAGTGDQFEQAANDMRPAAVEKFERAVKPKVKRTTFEWDSNGRIISKVEKESEE